MKRYNVCVVGIGAVGEVIVRVLRERKFPVGELKVLARSAREVKLDGKNYQVKAAAPEEFTGQDIVLFAGTEGEKGAAVTFAPEAIKRGGIVIDNGADFRMDEKIPLVVPEVNPEDIAKHRGLIANPNCSTIQFVVAVFPIHRAAGIKRAVIATYQAASGAGRATVEKLREESKKLLAGEEVEPSDVTPRPLGFNLYPHIGGFEKLDYTTEEWKLYREGNKIMHSRIPISATVARVPVINCHSMAVYLETEKKIAADEAREILRKAPGVIVMDDPKNNIYPTPLDADGRDEVFVGRIRPDPFVENGLHLWVVADNLRKGAATNAVQIAEEIIKNK